MVNEDLGVAVTAYVVQSFGEDQRNVGYWVFAERNGLRLQWDRAEEIPTDEQLETALYRANWDEVRKQRNALLVETDWYANTDVTMSDEMRTYRQALRDLPASCENSADVVFPTPPE